LLHGVYLMLVEVVEGEIRSQPGGEAAGAHAVFESVLKRAIKIGTAQINAVSASGNCATI
jgi:hypothetical protein